MQNVLVLRPEPGASATVERARQIGLDPISIPLFEIEPIDWSVPDTSRFDGLLFTSANAVRAAGGQLNELDRLKVYAIGEATAEAAREAGFEVTTTGDAGIEHLLASLDPDLSLLHLCGENRNELRDARQEITSVVVYRSKQIWSPDLSAANASIALVHSPRAGGRLAELVCNRETIGVIAISQVAANAVGDGWKWIEVAGQPTDDALLALAARLCKKPDPK